MEELIHNFGIDWKLLVTQAVNFLILLFILKKFAYQPILNMLRKRREDIEKGILMKREAEEKLAQSEQMKNKMLEESRVEALALIARAEENAKTRKDEILKEANKKVEGVIMEAKRIISEDKAKMREEVYGETEELVKLAVEKTIRKISTDKDARLVKEAIAELKTQVGKA